MFMICLDFINTIDDLASPPESPTPAGADDDQKLAPPYLSSMVRVRLLPFR
jgi:hypothetical protein